MVHVDWPLDKHSLQIETMDQRTSNTGSASQYLSSLASTTDEHLPDFESEKKHPRVGHWERWVAEREEESKISRGNTNLFIAEIIDFGHGNDSLNGS